MREPRRLFSGIYVCGDCKAEWEVTHVRELRCPECGGTDLERVEDDPEETEEN